jgi:Ohr subfamily peroxiredoxin
MDAQCTAVATASGGRRGHLRSSDGVSDLDLTLPKELGGLGKPGTARPEQLFAAGCAACFENAILRAAREQRVRLSGSSVTAEVGIGRQADGFFALRVALAVSPPGPERAQADELARAAHEEICPYSRAVRGNVEVAVTVE